MMTNILRALQSGLAMLSTQFSSTPTRRTHRSLAATVVRRMYKCSHAATELRKSQAGVGDLLTGYRSRPHAQSSSPTVVQRITKGSHAATESWLGDRSRPHPQDSSPDPWCVSVPIESYAS